MGLSEQWVAVCDDSGDASAALSGTEMELLGQHGGWAWARGFAGDLEELVAGAARQVNAAALGGWVADSDCAYLVFAEPEGKIVARLAINETRPFGEEVAGIDDLWRDLEARRSAFSSLAGWAAKHAPCRIDPARLAAEMPGVPGSSPPTDVPRFSGDAWYEEGGESGWVFAEDGVRLIYHRLGLPSLDATVFGSASRAPVEHLSIHAPDVVSMQAIFDRLHPRFGQRILVSAASDSSRSHTEELLAQQPQGEPADPPTWLAEVVSELRQCLADRGIESISVALMSGGQINVWPVRPPTDDSGSTGSL